MEISNNEMAHLFVSRMMDRDEQDKDKMYADAIKTAYKAIELCQIATSEVLHAVDVHDFSSVNAINNHERWFKIEEILKRMKTPRGKAKELYEKYKKKSIDVAYDIMEDSSPLTQHKSEYYCLVVDELENLIK